MAGAGTLIGGVVAVGVGEAASTALDPVLEPQRQAAWAKSQARIFELDTLAQLVAQGLLSEAAAITEGRRNGYSKDRVQRSIQLALKAAPVAELLELWRRGVLGDPQGAAALALIDHALAKEQIEPQYWGPIKELFYRRLDPAVIATAIQRGVMVAPFDLPYNVNVPVGNVKPFPVSPLDAAEEARAHGINVERLRIETALVGLPMALDRAAQAHFRGILTDGDYLRAVLEGNARGEWAEAELAVARQIPTAHDGIEYRLRGWTNDAGMYAQTARHGMSQADTDLLFKVTGRPLSFHQVFIGLRRGGVYDGPTDQIDPPFLKALQESNIRPEWYNLAWAQRHTYPSAFVLRALTESGDLKQPETRDILLFIGWPTALAEKVSTRWAGSVGNAGKQLVKAELIAEFEGGFISPSELRDHLTALGYAEPELSLEVHLADARRIKAWRDKGITAVNKSFLSSAMTVEQATALLQQLGVTDPATLTRITDIWVLERGLP